jgi:hypothetical protein
VTNISGLPRIAANQCDWLQYTPFRPGAAYMALPVVFAGPLTVMELRLHYKPYT